MKHLKGYKQFESVIIPDEMEFNSRINSMEDLITYGNENNFDVVNYNEFYSSLSDADKKTAPPRNGPAPFFALFHPVRKKPMFVLCNPRLIKMPNFKEIVDDIISHERVHAEQVTRRGGLTFNLPDPNTNGYFSNQDEIMAFSWTIANGLSKDFDNFEDAIKELDKPVEMNMGMQHGRMPQGRMGNMPPPPPQMKIHIDLWGNIKRSCDQSVLNKYRKNIFNYLEKIYYRNQD